jgi:hypothetical protein
MSAVIDGKWDEIAQQPLEDESYTADIPQEFQEQRKTL